MRQLPLGFTFMQAERAWPGKELGTMSSNMAAGLSSLAARIGEREGFSNHRIAARDAFGWIAVGKICNDFDKYVGVDPPWNANRRYMLPWPGYLLEMNCIYRPNDKSPAKRCLIGHLRSYAVLVAHHGEVRTAILAKDFT
jgi:hypothetical protein